MAIDKLSSYGYSFQVKTVTSLLTDKSFLQQISDILLPEFFESEASQWIVDKILKHFNTYKSAPTLDVFKIEVQSIERDIMKASVIDILKEALKYTESEDLEYVKENALDFCKKQCLKGAILQSVEYLEKGEYDDIKIIIDKAMKAGMSRDIGYEFLADIKKRYTENVRNTIETPWPLINDLAAGGFGKGELVIFVAGPGGGKCVGPRTEIDIEYEEFGLELTNAYGGVFTLWINPFETYTIDEVDMPGWLIINFFEDLPGPEI